MIEDRDEEHLLERRTVVSDYVECESASPEPCCRVAIDSRSPPGKFLLRLDVDADAMSFPRLLIDVMRPDGAERRRLVDSGDLSWHVEAEAWLDPPFLVQGLWCVAPQMRRRRDEAPTPNGLIPSRSNDEVRQTIMGREISLVVTCVDPIGKSWKGMTDEERAQERSREPRPLHLEPPPPERQRPRLPSATKNDGES